ncbi:MAG: septum site-determining protein, partial [Spirulina sp. DLM2.Bin59]
PDLPLPFQQFIESLLGLNALPFANASIARQTLLKIQLPEDIPQVVKPEGEAVVKPLKKRRPWLLIGGGLLGVILLATLIWWLNRRPRSEAPDRPVTCCIEQVNGFPKGEFVFTGEQEGIWTYIWQQANLIVKGETLAAILAERLNPEAVATAPTEPAVPVTTPTDEAPAADLNDELVEITEFLLDYRPQPSATAAIAQVQNHEAEFALSSLIDNLPADLWFSRVAYDGIAVYVAFSSASRDRNIPSQLNGRITLEQLRRLYTGEIVNWRELGGPDLPVKLYIPADEEAVQIFETRVLQDPEAIATFRRLATQRSRASAVSTEITRLSTFRTLNAVIQDFEERNVGAIAFGSLSRIFGQCSVYPLALQTGFNAPVAPLVQTNGLPISPATDLCNNKGSYRTNITAIRNGHYPLAYPITLIYPRDNRRAPIGEAFADVLRTDEGQLLLQRAGLVPLREIDPPAH